jgi:hypothetical protein
MMRFQPYLFLILMAFSELAVAATAPDTPAKAAVDSIYVQRVVITGNSAISSKRLQAARDPVHQSGIDRRAD